MPSMYDASVPTITRALKNFIHVLEKGAAHAEAKKIDPAVLKLDRSLDVRRLPTAKR